MAGILSVRVVSPVETVFDGEASSLVAPAWDGMVGVLPRHAPFITLLGGGTLTLTLPGGGEERLFLFQGIMKVEDDEVTILSEYAGPEPSEPLEPSDAWPDPGDPTRGLAEPGNPLV